MNTLTDWMKAGQDTATCLSASGAAPLTYAALRQLAKEVEQTLNSVGIGRNDRVALVLPNGAEMAASFVTVAACCTSAPLNPSYRADEFEFYLNDLNAKALVVEAGSGSTSIEVARKLGVSVLVLHPTPTKGAGSFTLDTSSRTAAAASQPGPAQADDVALVLHTSGTTSRPKIVPLTQRNVCASAQHIAASTRFTAQDRGLNVMPLFHIHGLIAGILAPLSQGGEVHCTSGFNALKFFAQMDEVKPTWYTAVPTMHQAILSRAANNKEVIARVPLRFIRSSSSSLPQQVLAELEATFHAPVIEAYGMTEAAHQMACNPLPPAQRKPGTVGIAAGPEVAIMDHDGHLLAAGATGEIVIRGPNVTPGYENNDKANAEAFTQGWFRTGDQGVMDSEGYISITGRLKEIINRGGEKISPREIDEILMDHPAVGQVVCFGIPHEKLGEEVGAAVVLREGQSASEKELRDYVATRVADFKVPRKILLLEEIPKGATGKLQRIGMAQKLGLA
ncbi:MAG: acyl--CoA ligase [Burkholderiales bacterium]|nr:acyl--CoA ligase [Burkholderiales bacterium]